MEKKNNERVLNDHQFDVIFVDGKGLTDCEMIKVGTYHHLIKDSSGRTVLVNKAAVKYYVVKEQ